MNNASILEIEKERIKFLEKYGLDRAEREEYQHKRKKVSQEEAEDLGKKLYCFIHKKTFCERSFELEQIDTFILDGADIEYKTDKKGDTPLLLCARRGFIKTFILLAKAGADINNASFFGTTPTMTSARHGHSDILKILIALKADINAQCLDGDTALMSAKRHDQIECFELLKQANANFGIRNIYNQTVIDIASQEEFDFTDFVSFENYIDDNFTEKSSQNLLQEATEMMREILGDFQVPQFKQPAKIKSKNDDFKKL